MKQIALFVIAVATSSVAAWAAPAPDIKLTLTVQQVGDLLGGIMSLDRGYDRVIKDGANERSVKDFYKISGVTRITLAKDIAKLRPVVEAYQQAHNNKITELSGGQNALKEGSNEANTLAAEDAKMLAVTQDVELVTIAPDDLKLDTNPIPPSVVAAIMPILVDPSAAKP